VKARKGEHNDARAEQRVRQLMMGDREVGRAEQRARRLMKGEREGEVI